MHLKFGELPVGTIFECQGKKYRKDALTGCLGMEDRLNYAFMGSIDVFVEGGVKEKLPWKPAPKYWSEYLSRPGPPLTPAQREENRRLRGVD